MEVVLHPPGELTVNGQVFSVVMKGMAFYGGRVIRRGDTWGDDFIISNHLLRSDAQALALSYFCAGVITFRTLESAFDEHPDERAVFDDIHVRLTFKRGLLTIVEALKKRIGKEGWKRVQEFVPEDGGKGPRRLEFLQSMVDSTKKTEVLKKDPKQDFLEKFLEINADGMYQLREFKSGDGEEELLGSRPKTVEDKLRHLTALLQKIEATNEEMESEKEAFVRRILDRIEQLTDLFNSATGQGDVIHEDSPGDGDGSVRFSVMTDSS
jgi:hypothetical protein